MSSIALRHAAPPTPWLERIAAYPVHRGLMLLCLGLAYTLPNIDFFINREEHGFRLDPQVLARLGVCAGCGLLALYRLPVVAHVYARFPGVWLLLIGLWSGFTVLTAISKPYAGAALFANACVMAFVPVAIYELKPLGFIRALFTVSVAFLLLNWALYFLVPSLGKGRFIVDGVVEYRLGGDPQNLGLQAGWTILLALYLWRKGESLLLIGPVLAFAAITAACTQSRTGLILCLFSIGMFILFTQGRASIIAGTFGLFGLVAFVALGLLPVDSDAVMSKLSRSGKTEEIYNLTGRTFIWDFVVNKIWESPVVGHGFGCARQALEDFEDSGYARGELHHGHNIFLNTSLTMGVPGAVLLGLLLAAMTWKALTSPNFLADTVVLGILLCGMAEPMLFGPMPRSHQFMFALAMFWRQLAEPKFLFSGAVSGNLPGGES